MVSERGTPVAFAVVVERRVGGRLNGRRGGLPRSRLDRSPRAPLCRARRVIIIICTILF